MDAELRHHPRSRGFEHVAACSRDQIISGEHASAEDRQTGFGRMAELALAAESSVRG